MIWYSSGKRTRVRSLERFNAPSPLLYSAGQAASFTMQDQIFVRRGEVVCRARERAPQVGVRVRANLFWLGRRALDMGRSYGFKLGAAHVRARLERVERVVNAATLSCVERPYVERNEVAECVLTLDRPIASDRAGEGDALSRFVLVDGYEIAGGGLILQRLEDEDYDGRNIRWSGSEPTARPQGLVVWLTGLSGAGKTTIAQETCRRRDPKQLYQKGIARFTGVGDRYEPPQRPDLTLDTDKWDEEECVERLLSAIQEKVQRSAPCSGSTH